MNLMKTWSKRISAYRRHLVMAFSLAFALAGTASADIASSDIGQGVTNLITDASIWLAILCPIAGGTAALAFSIRKSMADEADGKMWSKRIITAIICGAGGLIVGGAINLISSYFTA